MIFVPGNYSELDDRQPIPKYVGLLRAVLVPRSRINSPRMKITKPILNASNVISTAPDRAGQPLFVPPVKYAHCRAFAPGSNGWRKKLLAIYPASELDLQSRPPPPKAVLTANEAELVLGDTNITETSWRSRQTIPRNVLHTGIRRGNGRACRLDDIAQSERTIMIRLGKGKKRQNHPDRATGALSWIHRYIESLAANPRGVNEPTLFLT